MGHGSENKNDENNFKRGYYFLTIMFQAKWFAFILSFTSLNSSERWVALLNFIKEEIWFRVVKWLSQVGQYVVELERRPCSFDC